MGATLVQLILFAEVEHQLLGLHESQAQPNENADERGGRIEYNILS
jgi:hypothetical protein